MYKVCTYAIMLLVNENIVLNSKIAWKVENSQQKKIGLFNMTCFVSIYFLPSSFSFFVSSSSSCTYFVIMIDDWKHKAHYLFPILSCFTVLSTATAYYLSKTKRRRIALKDHTNCKKYGTIPSPPNKFPIIGIYDNDKERGMKAGETNKHWSGKEDNTKSGTREKGEGMAFTLLTLGAKIPFFYQVIYYPWEKFHQNRFRFGIKK